MEAKKLKLTVVAGGNLSIPPPVMLAPEPLRIGVRGHELVAAPALKVGVKALLHLIEVDRDLHVKKIDTNPWFFASCGENF